MRPMPLPVRVAAGLVATALEQARKVPEQLAELPVTAASRVVQAGMRVQQRITKLAIKGDEVFAMFRPAQDTPPWARFDEDDSSEPANQRPAQPQAQRPPDVGPATNGRGEMGEVDEAYVAQQMTPRRPVAASLTRPEPARTEPARTEPARTEPARQAPFERDPPALPGYDELSLAQLRGKLRTLTLDELETLLEYEHAHQDRAAFVTMLSNRISTVRSR